MPVNKTDFCNKSIPLVRQSSRLVSFENDKNTIADRCRLFYPQAITLALEEYDFTFATKKVILQEIANAMVPPPYSYALRIPQDWIRDALCGVPKGVAFEMGADDEGLLMYASQIGWYYPYIYDISEKPWIFPTSFAMACQYFLAALLAPEFIGLKGRESKDAIDRLYGNANAYLNMAKSRDGNIRGWRDKVEDGR